jgi:hypothetical protein
MCNLCSLLLGAKHEEAEEALVTAQWHCDELTRQGLVNDAYTDVGGVYIYTVGGEEETDTYTGVMYL